MPTDWHKLWHYASTDGVPRRALKVALFVGTVLTLINQGDAIFGGGRFSWLKAALTYVVPYLVSSYSAAMARMNSSG